MTSAHPLRRVLRLQHMSQSRLARLLDVNESLISHYLSGRREPPEDFYPRAAKVLGVRVEDIDPNGEPVAA